MNPAGDKRMWRRDASSALLVVTLGYLFVGVVSCLWFVLSLKGHQILIFIVPAGSIVGMSLFVSHLVLACMMRGRRLLHSGFVVLVVTGFILTWWAPELHRNLRRRHFIQQERFAYEEMVKKVVANRTILRDRPRALNAVVERPYGASAMTNADGSVTILFPGSEVGPRHGYLYHSGELLSAMPFDPEAHFVHLTNGWYEY